MTRSEWILKETGRPKAPAFAVRTMEDLVRRAAEYEEFLAAGACGADIQRSIGWVLIGACYRCRECNDLVVRTPSGYVHNADLIRKQERP